ncbi:MAG: Hpt domain-containing protein [Clostridia bacterium]
MDNLLTQLEMIGCDVRGGLARFAGNEALYLKFLYRFPDEATLSKFEKAMRENDYEAALREIHTFKGVAGNLGLDGLYTIAQKIQQMLQASAYDQAAACAQDLFHESSQVFSRIRACAQARA